MHTQVPCIGCYLAQRVHGSKREAKESTENSKAFELDELDQIIASDEPTPPNLHSLDELCGQRIQNRSSDEPTV
jgi:hypothetical protein